jgi:CxxC motif-containing protein (DUF1111 family)
VPLYSADTELEPQRNRVEDGIAYTYISERVRERHAREDQFNRYRTFPRFYFENRTFELEIIDKSATKTKEVIFHVITDHPVEGDLPFTGRFFFSGVHTVADYFIGVYFDTVTAEYDDDRHHYRYVLRSPTDQGRIKSGAFMEIEISMFLSRINGVGGPRGDANYYSRTWLLQLGKPGMIPWEEAGGLPTPGSMAEASSPLPDIALAGGTTTLSADISAEPERTLQQMGQNLAPHHAQEFVEGRRLHHTDFDSGMHSEAGNGRFAEMAGKAGPLLNERSCISCHTNNGRSLPNQVKSPINNMVFKIGTADTAGDMRAHPQYGSALQTQSLTGAGEGLVTIESYTTIRGQFADGSPYELQKPQFQFHTDEPVTHYAALSAPPLIGLGLLEAIAEDDLLRLADPNDTDGDGISGRASIVTDLETGAPRLGRFGWKADRVDIRQQTAVAFRDDMGVRTSLFPDANGRAELDDEHLSKLTTYLATLGVPPRRNWRDQAVEAGENLFTEAGCASCHQPEWTTGAHHPFAELRRQTIRPYTDLLLHDMGDGLASSLPGESATRGEWRTPPLWGLGLTKAVGDGVESYLHDGRARSLTEAILWHGGEGEAAKDQFLQMTRPERQELLAFLRSL